MRLLLHALATSEAAPPPGLRGRPLAMVRQAELLAYATRFETPPDDLGRADLLAHHEIVSGLAAQIDLLPARFPTWFADNETLRGELDRRHDDLVEALEGVRGRVEIAVTAVWIAAADELPPPKAEAATPGRKYLLGRQHAFSGSDKRRERARALADQIERQVANDLVEVRHQICPSTTVALSTALLVPRASAVKIKARLARAEQDVRILVNGPWPPYTFANVV